MFSPITGQICKDEQTIDENKENATGQLMVTSNKDFSEYFEKEKENWKKSARSERLTDTKVSICGSQSRFVQVNDTNDQAIDHKTYIGR